MKACFGWAIAFSAISVTVSIKSHGASFGPRNCVAVARSTAGSCVISTDCQGVDTSATEFAFDCVRRDGIVRHSFGTGGFEEQEKFDTEVKCDRCESPSAADILVKSKQAKPVMMVGQAKQATQAKQQAKQQTKQKSGSKFWPFTGKNSIDSILRTNPLAAKKPEFVRYGPDGCISTWKNKDDHCIMKTACAKEEMKNYEFGLICVDKVGSPVRHLFGKDSFDKEETFDTLIRCDKCLGLEDIPDAVALNGQVVTMSREITALKDVMVNISKNVEQLNKEVFPSGPAPAPAAAASAPQAAPAKLMVHHARQLRARSNRDEDDRNERPSDVQKAVMSDDEEQDDDDDHDDEDED